jgi:hypothetical protein
MRAARAAPVGRPATKAARALSPQNEGSPAEPLLGNRKVRTPTEPAARPPSLGLRRLLWPPQRGQGSGSAALGQSLACQPLPFRWKVGDLRALRLAALAVLGRVLVPGPAVAAPALAGVHLLGHSTPLSQVLLSACVYPAWGDAHIPSRRDGTAARQRRPRASHGRLWDGTSCSSRGVELSRRWGSFRATDAAPAATGLAARPCPVVAALGGTSSTQTLASRAGTTMAFRSGRRG